MDDRALTRLTRVFSGVNGSLLARDLCVAGGLPKPLSG